MATSDVQAHTTGARARRDAGALPLANLDAPRQADLDRCVHCGLCLNACPTYRELKLEMDSPRGRIFQMRQVADSIAAGDPAPLTDSYRKHIDLCLACRGCESACPSGVSYGRLIEAARAQIEHLTVRPFGARLLRKFVFEWLLPSRTLLRIAGLGMRFYEQSGLQRFVRGSGLSKEFGKLGEIEALAPPVEPPFFLDQIGKVFPPAGAKRYRVAFLSGCIANVCFSRLNEATVRVLQANGCEVAVVGSQTCCGALHVHAGLRETARRLARQNIDAIQQAEGIQGSPFDAIITNAAGCGSTLKEYHELLEHDSTYAERAIDFASRMKDVTEFLASIDLNPALGPIRASVTYQDSCHLAHGQRVRSAPRDLLKHIPGLTFKEMPLSDICCGSAGIYNVVETDMSMAVLGKKMQSVNSARTECIATANPGCILQLRVGVQRHGYGQRVAHVIELLDESYRNASAAQEAGPTSA
jgi:glycolate oxidase iron-sulfur subunit